MAFQDLIDTASQIYGIFTQPRETPAPIQYGPTASQDSISTSTQYQQPPFEPPTDRAPIFQASGPVTPGMFPKPGTMPQQPQTPQAQPQQQFQPPVPGGVTIGQVPQQQAISPTDLDQPQIPRFDPGKTFDRILGVETGGRHRDQQGNIITSSKGAMGIAQIMPSTAARPGYGIKPLVGDEIYDETKNREFGRSYFNAMVNQFGGDVEKGVAAYNAGEGGVKRAMAQAAQVGQPQNWKRFLPTETQAYLGKVIGPLAAEQRQAQAQPAHQVQQAVMPQGDAAVAEMMARPQIQQQAVQQPAQAAAPAALPGIPNPQQMEQFDAVMRSNNPDTMIAFMDKAEPWQRMLLQNQIADTIQLNREKERAKIIATNAASSGDSRQLERSLKDKSIGHLVLGYIAGLIGGPELGREVAGQGGWFNSYTTMEIDGQQVALRLSPKGTPMQGVYTTGPLQGTEVPLNELRKTYGLVGAMKNIEQGKTVFGDITGKVTKDKFILETYQGTNKPPQYRRIGGGANASREEIEALTQLGVAGTLDTQALTQIQKSNIELARDWEKGRIEAIQAGPIAANKWLGEFNAKHRTNFSFEDIRGAAPQIQMDGTMIKPGLAQQTQVAQTTQAAPTTAQPSAQAATTAKPAAGATPAAIEQAKEVSTAGQVEEAKTTGKNIGELKNKQVQLETDSARSIELLDKVVTHPGMKSAVGLKGPEKLFGLKAKPFEGTPAADFMSIHDQIMGQTFLQAFQQLRGGGQITEAEGVKATAAYNRMSTATTEKEYIEAAREFQYYLKLGIDRQRMQLGQPQQYNTLRPGAGGFGAQPIPMKEYMGAASQIPGQSKQRRTSTGIGYSIQ